MNVLSRASRRAKNTDALQVGGECRVSDPNVLAVWRGGYTGLMARRIPHARFACI